MKRPLELQAKTQKSKVKKKQFNKEATKK